MATMTAEKKHKDEQKENGYVLLRGLLSSGEIKSILSGIEAAAQNPGKIENQIVFEPGFSIENAAKSGLRSIRKIGRLHELPGVFESVGPDSPIGKAIGNIFGGEEITLVYSAAFAKPPQIGTQTPWHQDQAIWPDWGDCLSCWFALDPATEENGCLQVIPKFSREKGYVPHIFDKELNHLRLPDESLQGYPVEKVEMEPGDGLIFDGLVPHFSDMNRSSRRRLGATIVFATKSRWKERSNISRWIDNRLKLGMAVTNQGY